MEPNLTLPFTESHAFIVGIDDYSNGIDPLDTAVNDAREIAKVLSMDIHGYTPHLHLDATKEEMEAMFREMKEKIQQNHRVIFYFAGHGIALDTDAAEPKGYLVPSDADGKNRSSLVPMDALGATMEALKDSDLHVHVLLILDCCFSGAFKWASGTRSFTFEEDDILYEERFLRFTKHRACQVITSTSHDQKAADTLPTDFGTRNYEKKGDNNNSPFAWALIQALERGEADVERKDYETGREENDGVITATELSAFLRDTVEPLTRKGGNGQSPSFFPLKYHDSKGEFIFLNPKNKLNLPPAPDFNPYKGLRVFQDTEKDIKQFFGRDAAVKEMEKRLKGTSLLIVSAPSGFGKSSAVKAGLFPMLQITGQFQRLESIRPSEGFKAISELGDNLDPSERHLILIDQFEELFHLEKQLRETFEKGLIEIYQKLQSSPQSIAKIVLTIRSDFEWHLRDSDFGKSFWEEAKISEFLYRLPPMTRQELEDVMRKPAELIAYDFESDFMVDQILKEIDHAPGALPLLSFTLNKLYEFRDRDERLFRLKDYTEKLGGINGALSTIADQVFESLGAESTANTQAAQKENSANLPTILKGKQAIMRNLFLRMVRLNDGSYTRRRVYLKKPSRILTEKDLNELDYPDHLDEMVEEVLEAIGGGKTEGDSKLLQAQLVVRDQDEHGPFIEPIHDSLLNHWGKCLNWIKHFGREHLVIQRKLWQAVEEYHTYDNSNSDKSNLISGPPLWHTNPKLELVLLAICDPYETWLSEKTNQDVNINSVAWLLWEDRPTEAQLNTLKPWSKHFGESDLHILFEKINAQMDPWLNEFELAFVKKSFEKQKSEIERLRAERDEAIRLANEARAVAMAARARQIVAEDPTVALNLAQIAFHTYQSDESISAFLDIDRLAERDATYSMNFIGHKGNITSIAFSPDGRTMLTSSQDHTAKLWDIASGNEIRCFEGHDGEVFSAAFSPDGKSLLTGSWDMTAILWELESGDKIKTFIGHEYAIYDVAFSSDGKSILTGSGDEKAILWDVESGKEIKSFKGHIDFLSAVAFCPDGKSLLTASWDKDAVLWDIESGAEIKRFMGHSKAVSDIAFSPDGKFLLTGSHDETAKLWNIESGLEVKSFTGHSYGIYAVAYSPDGKTVLTGSEDNTAKLWDSASGLEIKNFRHRSSVTALAFSPDGKSMLTGAEDDMAKLWDVSSRLEIKTLLGHNGSIFSVAFSPDGKTMLTGSFDETAKLWDIESGLVIKNFIGHCNAISSVAFSQDGQSILTGSIDHSVRLWDIESGHELACFKGHSSPIYTVAFSPDGKRVLTGGEDQIVKMWDITSGLEIKNFAGHTEKIYSIALSPDGKSLLTGSWDKTARLWDIETGQEIKKFSGHSQAVSSVAFSPSGTTVLTGSHDNTAKLWDIKSGLEIKNFCHKTYILSVAFSPDGKSVLTGAGDKTTKLWDIYNGHEIKSFIHGDEVSSVAFSPDGKAVLTGTKDGKAKLWDASLKWNDRVYKLNDQERKLYGIPEDVVY